MFNKQPRIPGLDTSPESRPKRRSQKVDLVQRVAQMEKRVYELELELTVLRSIKTEG